jgi:ribosomal RNA-processing protein 9
MMDQLTVHISTIALWTVHKKKPVYIVPVAHGLDEHHSETEGIVSRPRWITSLACLQFSDLIASGELIIPLSFIKLNTVGSWEGQIRLWKVELSNPRDRRISAIGSLEAPGVVNSLQLIAAPSGAEAKWAEAGKVVCVAGSGGELSSGRWLRVDACSAGLVYVI